MWRHVLSQSPSGLKESCTFFFETRETCAWKKNFYLIGCYQTEEFLRDEQIKIADTIPPNISHPPEKISIDATKLLHEGEGWIPIEGWIAPSIINPKLRKISRRTNMMLKPREKFPFEKDESVNEERSSGCNRSLIWGNFRERKESLSSSQIFFRK